MYESEPAMLSAVIVLLTVIILLLVFFIDGENLSVRN